jgi:diguanylate cyclase (GGDEF)-like protein/PAS domain S-box-containing protein
MQGVFVSVFELATSQQWLVTANFILSVLLAMWMLRYRRLYLSVRDEQANTDELIENLSEGIYRSLPDGRQIKANKALVRLNGYRTEEELLANVHDIAREWYVDPNRRAEFKHILETEGRITDFVSEIYRHKTRERIWISESGRIVRDKNSGRTLYYEGSVREITETMKRLKLEEQFSKLMHEVPGALFQFEQSPEMKNTVTYLSPGFERITGIPIAEMMENPGIFIGGVPEEDRMLYAHAVGAPDRLHEPYDIEHRFICRDGSEKWLRVSATPEVKDGWVTWHGYMSDVTVRKTNEIAVERLAYFDTLTGLPNRRAFLDRMACTVERCHERGDRGALLFIDLDNFKSLNDTQGHDIGDQYLVQVAKRLRAAVGENDLVARIGGDEFVVVLEAIGDSDAAAAMQAIKTGNRVVGAMRASFMLGEVSHRASASIGVVVFDGESAAPDEILKRADIAMYEAKSAGRDSLALYDPVSMSRESERYRLLADLRDAFGRDGPDFELYYQPQMDDAGQVVAAEALIRWHHPVHGTIYPDRFIPLVEQFGLIGDLGRMVLREGVKRLALWRADPALARLRLSINLSVQSFHSEDLVPLLRQLLAEYQVDGSKLTIEVTEHVMARDQKVIAARMNELKQLGIRLSLDDFGTGYSSLTYLKRLPFDEVKIDGSFVADIETAENDRALVKTILAMAHTLGLSVVAEHVESCRQEAFLRAHGCDCFQGWLYSKALPADGFAAFVRTLAPEPAVFQLAGIRQPA